MCQAAETRGAERDARAQLRAQFPGLFPWLMFTLPSSRQDTMESRPFSGTKRELLWLPSLPSWKAFPVSLLTTRVSLSSWPQSATYVGPSPYRQSSSTGMT